MGDREPETPEGKAAGTGALETSTYWSPTAVGLVSYMCSHPPVQGLELLSRICLVFAWRRIFQVLGRPPNRVWCVADDLAS